MPGLTGLEVASAAADTSPRTQVVFVTAYDQYAIDAFDNGAVDYLLKPVTRERLDATVQRLQVRAAGAHPDAATLAALIRQLDANRVPDKTPLSWITASAGKDTRLILVEDVAYFRADNKYTTVMTAEGEALLRTPIRELLGLLDPAMFKQVHRSTIVNRSEEHTSELQSLMRISYAVFCLKKKREKTENNEHKITINI